MSNSKSSADDNENKDKQQTDHEASSKDVSVPPASHDLIQVTITPPGEGAITTILLDGKDAIERLQSIFRGKNKLSRSNSEQLTLGTIHNSAGKMIDEVIAAPCAAADSKTGHEQIEISCHGGKGAGEAVQAALSEVNFRSGLPWEIEIRGHRNGRLPLPTLEAIMKLPFAQSPLQTSILLAHEAFRNHWEKIGLDTALGARGKKEGWRELLHQEVKNGLALSTYALRVLRRHRVAICGPANAGKSTLSNALLRSDESIVHASPGTTRDRLIRTATLVGLCIELTDSAGLRTLSNLESGQSQIELEGQRRALAAAREADLTLIVLDATQAPEEHTFKIIEQLTIGNFLLVFNKTDLEIHPETEALGFALETRPIHLSAMKGEGVELLEQRMGEELLGNEPNGKALPFSLRQQRHLINLKEALESGMPDTALINSIRAITGTRPNEEELAVVISEWQGIVVPSI